MAGNFWKSSHCQEWLLEREEIILKRYQAHGIKDEGAEIQHQKTLIFLCDFTQALGIEIRMKQQVISTATLYMKRFYLRNSFKAIDPMLLIPTTIYLASKVEQFENISLTALVNASCAVVQEKFLWAFKRHFPYRAIDVLNCEFYLAESMDFSMVVYHPYRPLLTYLEALPTDLDEHFKKKLLTTSWTTINDSLRTDAIFLFPPHQIALATLVIAAVIVGRGELQSWFMDLPGVDLTSVRQICMFLMDYYEFVRDFDMQAEVPQLLANLPKPAPAEVNGR